MTDFDQDFWERLWSKTLREHPDKVAQRQRRPELVVCAYVHVASSVAARVSRMASGVAPGGALFMVGHRRARPRALRAAGH